MEPEAKFDGALLQIAQNLGQAGVAPGIDGLLDTYFSFLRRKTDFFSGNGVGLPAVKEKVLASLQRQWDIAQREEAKRAKAAEAAKAKSAAAAPAPAPAAPVPAPVAPAPVAPAPSGGGGGGGGGEPAAAAPAGDASAAAAAGAGKLGPGNGGTTDRYTWAQTLQDVSITFPVPAGTKSKDVTVEFKAGSIKVLLRGAPAPLLQAPLPKRVKPDGCEWTLTDGSDGRALSVFLTKDNQMEWWTCVGEGEPTIDVTKVEPENSKLSDLDPETRKTVEKMMFDQAQKAKGLPSSDEMEKMAVIERFKKQHPEMVSACVRAPFRAHALTAALTPPPPPPPPHPHFRAQYTHPAQDFSQAKMDFGGGAGGFPGFPPGGPGSE
jgi:hypothetical protein